MNLCKRIQKKNILVIGDIMLDIYIEGKVSRISPEAPVPVLLKQNERYVPGGASNVASNLISAGQRVAVCSVIGNDIMGDRLIKLLEDKDIDCSMIIKADNRITTTKTRLVGQNHQQIARLDEEDSFHLSEEEEAGMINMVADKIRDMDIVVLSDYLKGVLSPNVCERIIELANRNDKKVIIDVKDKSTQKYQNAYLLKPNLKELRELTGFPAKDEEGIVEASRRLLSDCNCRYVLTTCGENGMYIVDDSSWKHIESINKKVYDVSGAGDTVIAYMAVFLTNGFGVDASVKLSNDAAGIKVTKAGTAPVELEELEEYLRSMSADNRERQKVVTIDVLTELLKKYTERKIVFTNGCFDILHYGHIHYLKKAAELGDCLIVGLNSDSSVKRLKGETRPVNHENDRAEVLAALGCVDFVVVFEEDTPYELIKAIRPDVLVKGGDYTPEQVVGRDIVEAAGGELVLIPFVEGHSTTAIISRMKER